MRGPFPQARLVGLAAAQELGLPWPEMEARLDALAALMPDIGVRLASLRPQLVAPLVRDLDQLPGEGDGSGWEPRNAGSVRAQPSRAKCL
jgi:hypothetical protein